MTSIINNEKSSFFVKERGFNFNLKDFKVEDSIQVGYIYLPEGEIKEDYEKECRRYGIYSVVLESGTIKKKCVSLLDKPLRVPERSSYLGEAVLLVFPNNSDIPFIIKVINNNSVTYDYIDENSVSKVIQDEVTAIKVSENIKDKNYSINIMSEDDQEVSINLNVSAPNKKGKIRLNVNGDCNIFAEKNINILTNKEINIKIRDLVKNQKFHEIKYNFDTGLYVKDRWDNTITMNGPILRIHHKNRIRIECQNADIEVQQQAKLIAHGEVRIDADGAHSIHIGNDESLVINQSTICCFTGQPHFLPITNVKTRC